MATYYLDFEGGNDSNDGTTFANRWKTITSGATAARLTPGDTIRVMKSPDPVSLGVNGTFTKLSPTITLASAVTANVSLCNAAWTASANVTTTTSTTRKEGTNSTSITPAAAFTTGVLAYEATGTLDLSAYQKVSFWIRSSGTHSANTFRIDLCSDTAGATPVNSFTINVAMSAVNSWYQFTFDNGAALGNSIKSVALTALVDPGTPTILLDNIFVTNNLSLTSLIGTSSSATGREWYPVRSVNGTTVTIDANVNGDVANQTSRGFSETTTTTTAYIREPIRLTAGQTTNEAGTATARYTFSGGWDRTNMSTQNGMTFIMAPYLTAVTNSRAFCDFEYFGVVNATTNYSASSPGSDQELSYCYFGYTASLIFNVTASNICLLNCHIMAYGSATLPDGIHDNVYAATNNTSVATRPNLTLNNCTLANNTTGINGHNLTANNLTLNNNDTAIGTAYGFVIDGLTTNSNATVFSAVSGNVNNWTTTSDTTLVATSTNRRERLNLSRYSTYAGAQYNGSTLVVYDVNTPVRAGTTRSWRHDVQSNHRSWLPITQRLQPFAVGASTLVTFSIWTQRSSTSVVGVVRLRGNIVAGVNADVTATASAAINTWEQLTITFTPSAAGAAIIELESYSTDGNTGSVFFGDASVSQA